MLTLGELFTLIVYGQLILEQAELTGPGPRRRRPDLRRPGPRLLGLRGRAARQADRRPRRSRRGRSSRSAGRSSTPSASRASSRRSRRSAGAYEMRAVSAAAPGGRIPGHRLLTDRHAPRRHRRPRLHAASATPCAATAGTATCRAWTGRSCSSPARPPGSGCAAAEGFARLGAAVRMLARDAGRGRARARAQVARGDRQRRRAGAAVRPQRPRHRARASPTSSSRASSAWTCSSTTPASCRSTRTLSPDGIELTFATNVLGPFLLTELLLPLLRDERAGADRERLLRRHVHAQARRGDLQSTRGDFDGPAAYARTKRAEVILTEMLAERLAGTGVVVHAMHPGWADTPGVQTSLPRFHSRDASRCCARPSRAPTRSSGSAPPTSRRGAPASFWHDRRRRPTHRVPWTRESPADRDALWAACEQLSGLRPQPRSDLTDGPLRRNRREPARAGGRLRLPQRLLDDAGVGPRRRRGRAPGRRADRRRQPRSASSPTSWAARRR